MKPVDREQIPEQLALFERRPIRTSWSGLPLDIRQEVIRLVAKMLVDHQRARVCRSASGEGKVQ